MSPSLDAFFLELFEGRRRTGKEKKETETKKRVEGRTRGREVVGDGKARLCWRQFKNFMG